MLPSCRAQHNDNNRMIWTGAFVFRRHWPMVLAGDVVWERKHQRYRRYVNSPFHPLILHAHKLGERVPLPWQKGYIPTHGISGFWSLAKRGNPMTTTVQKQVLINARALIADPAHWTRGALARSADDNYVDWYDRSATKWCAQGAIYRAAYDLVGPKRSDAHR
jgi:hypothetical protein